MALYWHLLHRLQSTFRGTAYYPNRTILMTLKFFLSVTLAVTFTLISFVFLYLLRQSALIKSHNEDNTIFVICIMCALLVSDFIISSLIMYSFINGLRQLVIDNKQSVMMNEIEARELHSDMAADDDYNDACSSFNIAVYNVNMWLSAYPVPFK